MHILSHLVSLLGHKDSVHTTPTHILISILTTVLAQALTHLSQAKPAPSHTPANTHTSPAVPALKPSYSQVTKLGVRAYDQPCDLQVLWGSHDPVKETGDPLRDWSATQSDGYRYVMHPLNHPVGTTNRGMRINKVVQLRIIGAQPQQPQQMGNPQSRMPQRGKGPTCVPYVNLP